MTTSPDLSNHYPADTARARLIELGAGQLVTAAESSPIGVDHRAFTEQAGKLRPGEVIA